MRAKRALDKALREDATASSAINSRISLDSLPTNDSASPGTGTPQLETHSTISFHAPVIDIHPSPGSSSKLSFNISVHLILMR